MGILSSLVAPNVFACIISRERESRGYAASHADERKQANRSRRSQSIFRRRIGPSLFSNLCLRPAEKYWQLARCGTMRCNGSVYILTGCAGQYYCSVPTNIPHLLLLFSSSLFRVSLLRVFPHLFVLPFHSYLLHPCLSPSSIPLTRIRSNAHFREL